MIYVRIFYFLLHFPHSWVSPIRDIGGSLDSRSNLQTGSHSDDEFDGDRTGQHGNARDGHGRHDVGAYQQYGHDAGQPAVDDGTSLRR